MTILSTGSPDTIIGRVGIESTPITALAEQTVIPRLYDLAQSPINLPNEVIARELKLALTHRIGELGSNKWQMAHAEGLQASLDLYTNTPLQTGTIPLDLFIGVKHSEAKILTFPKLTETGMAIAMHIFSSSHPHRNEALNLLIDAVNPSTNLISTVNLYEANWRNHRDIVVFLVGNLLGPFARMTYNRLTNVNGMYGDRSHTTQTRLWKELFDLFEAIPEDSNYQTNKDRKAIAVWNWLNKKIEQNLVIGGSIPIEGGNKMQGVIILPNQLPTP